ncbi:MAG TPA: hypothetical protein VL689_02690 [Paraburkholderia sp.]|jgi:hypothetical protein|nr:hypothetical protein [Paraburkholderia sp.]
MRPPNAAIRFREPPLIARDLQCAVRSGTLAGAGAAAVAAWRSTRDGKRPLAPINAVTHCIWPRRALEASGFSVRHTLLGLAIHQAAAVFWAVGFEALTRRWTEGAPRENPVMAGAAAAATAATAYVVDYHVVPKRLTPGFETHLSRRSLTAVYVAIGAALLAAALSRSSDD